MQEDQLYGMIGLVVIIAAVVAGRVSAKATIAKAEKKHNVDIVTDKKFVSNTGCGLQVAYFLFGGSILLSKTIEAGVGSFVLFIIFAGLSHYHVTLRAKKLVREKASASTTEDAAQKE